MATETPSVGGAIPETIGGVTTLKSPVPPEKTGISTEQKQQQGHVSLPAYATTRAAPNGSQTDANSPYMSAAGGSMSQSQILTSPMLASPLTAGALSGPGSGPGNGESMREPHLSGHEPRYFPGIVTRGQRKGSTRQNSQHENDESVARRVSGRKDKDVSSE